MIHVCNGIDHAEGDENIPNSVKHKLYSHRSDIQILIKNWGYSVIDLNSAIKYEENENSSINLIDSLIKLENYEKAIEICKQNLAVIIS